MCMYKEPRWACIVFYLSGRVFLSTVSTSHLAAFFFSFLFLISFSFFLFLDQASSMSAQGGESYCLFKLEFFQVPLLLSQRIDGVWDPVLSPFLCWYIFIFKVSLPDKMPLFNGSASSSFISCEKKMKASYKEQADNFYLTLVLCKAWFSGPHTLFGEVTMLTIGSSLYFMQRCPEGRCE